jgi:hypothetical protein
VGDQRADTANVTIIDIPQPSLWRRVWDAILLRDPSAKSVTTEIQARGYGISFRMKRTYQRLAGDK